MSGPSLSDGRVCTDEVIFAENEGREVISARALHSTDVARTQEQQELGTMPREIRGADVWKLGRYERTPTGKTARGVN